MTILSANDPLAIDVVTAIRAGDVDGLRRLLGTHPGLAAAEIGGRDGSRSLLHVATDWPGHIPNGPAIVATLIAAGADVNGRLDGSHREAPLHWAASSDDVALLDALLDAGADIEADGACIAGGTALDDAVAFGQWKAARRLVDRGAKTALWHSAALGLMDRVEGHFNGPRTPARHPWGKSRGEAPDEVTVAFWCACHGGQGDAARYLLDRGAALNWISTWDQLTPLDTAPRAGAVELVEWLRGRGGRTAAELRGGR